MGYQAKSAIVGLGISEMGRVYGRPDADIEVGMRVEVTCQQAGDVMVPYWKAAS
jgi:hypothetical protein